MTDEQQKGPEPKAKPPIVPVNGKTADLRNALPLTIGDQEKLTEMGLSLLKLESQPELAYPLARYLIHKANPAITDQEIRDHVPMQWVGPILRVMREYQTKADLPF